MRSTFALFALTSVVASAPAFAQTAADILAANKAASGGAAWDGKAAIKIDYDYAGQGMTGKTHSLDDLKGGAFLDDFAVGPVTGANGFDGVHAWAKDQSGAVTDQQGGEAAPLAVNESYRRVQAWWQPDFGGAAVTRDAPKTEGGTAYDVLTVVPKGGKSFDAWFDGKTHLLARIVEVQSATPTTTTLSDYRAVDGVMLPGRTVVGTGDAKFDQAITMTKAAFLPTPDASAFAKPNLAFTDTSFIGGAKQTSVKFQLLNNHVVAPVTVNGKGPYLFIFDTGGVNCVTPTLVKDAALAVEGSMEARGAGSGTMEASFSKVKSLQIGDAVIKDQTLMSIPLDRRVDIEGYADLGMIGFETYRRFVTRFDYGTGTLTLIDPKSFDPKDAGMPVHIDFSGNVPEIEATYDGIKGKFMIDTGNRGSLVLTGPFVAKNHLRERAAKGVEATTGWGVGGATRSYVYRGGELRIGTVSVPSPVAMLSTDTGGAMTTEDLAGNIGGAILKRFVVTFDYEHNTMYLKPAAPIADLGTFDRSGMWINKDPSGFKVVDLTAGAPAAEAGLKTGDVIIKVDGRPATALSLPDLRKQLRTAAPGSVVTLTVQHDGAGRDVKLTLRDLI